MSLIKEGAYIEKLNLSEHYLRKEKCFGITEAIKSSKTLSHLDFGNKKANNLYLLIFILENCCIHDYEVKLLSLALKEKNILVSLNLCIKLNVIISLSRN